MNREIIIAIILGFGIGLIVTYGVWTANRSLQEQQSVSPIPTPITDTNNSASDSTPLAQDNTTQNLLRLIKPTPNTLTTEESLIINGFTDPTETILIISENENITLDPQSTGEFQTEITLSTGINYLTIFSVNNSGTNQRLDQTIILSSE